MNRSIDLLERLAHETHNIFRMNRRGYLYVTADEARVGAFTRRAAHTADLGAGPLRIHSTSDADYQPEEPIAGATGADLLLEPELIRKHFPAITPQAAAVLHVRRAGWLSAQQLGMYLLEQARRLGVRLESCEVERVELSGGRVSGVVLGSGERIDCPVFVNAAGPFLKRVGTLLGIDIPVETELHLKISFKDHLRVVDRAAPLMIWDDGQSLPWDAPEREALQADPETRWLTEAFPPGVHARPEGAGESQTILMLWDYAAKRADPVFPLPADELYPEVVLRGLATMLPGLQRYFGRAPRPYVDGGYYVKTPENRLLAGPLPVDGAYVIGGLSGYGIMSCCAAGELLAACMAHATLPGYAAAFSIDRYNDPAYRAALAKVDSRGQL
jgi:glycine/D-amino acid oxidase-like deaminating enzyme